MEASLSHHSWTIRDARPICQARAGTSCAAGIVASRDGDAAIARGRIGSVLASCCGALLAFFCRCIGLVAIGAIESYDAGMLFVIGESALWAGCAVFTLVGAAALASSFANWALGDTGMSGMVCKFAIRAERAIPRSIAVALAGRTPWWT